MSDTGLLNGGMMVEWVCLGYWVDSVGGLGGDVQTAKFRNIVHARILEVLGTRA